MNRQSSIPRFPESRANDQNAKFWLPLALGCLLYLGLFALRTAQARAVFGDRVDLYPLAAWRTLPLDATPDQLRLASYLLLGLVALAYLFAIRAAPRLASRDGFLKWVIAPYIVLGLSSLVFYPAVSAPLDTVDYTMHARIQLVHGNNPYLARGADYEGTEPLLRFAEAKQRPAVYGPVALYAGLIPALVGGGSLVASILAFKALFFSAGLLVLWLIWVYGAHMPDGHGGRAILSGVIVGWNPVLHLVSHGAGHNDILMALFLAGSVVAIGLHKPLWGFVGWTMSVLVKFISAPLVIPLVAWSARRAKTGDGLSGSRLALVGLALSGLIAAAAFAPYGPAGVLQTVTTRYAGLVDAAGTSKIGILANLASRLLSRIGIDWTSASLASVIGLALPLAWLLFTALRGWNVSDAAGFVRVAVESFLFYITFVSLPVYAQYVVTPLVLAGFLSARDKWHLAAVIVASLALVWDSLYLVYPARSYALWENILHQVSHASVLVVLGAYLMRRMSVWLVSDHSRSTLRGRRLCETQASERLGR